MSEPPRPLAQLPVLLVDCQATAPSPTQGHLIDISWCLTTAAESDERASQATFASLVALPAGTTLTPRIRRMTGIDEGALAVAPPVATIAEALRGALARAPVNTLLVAHYARFEQPFLRALLGEELYEARELVCTHALAQRLLPDLPRRSLRALAGYLGQTPGEHKRAWAHVAATAHIWRTLVAMLAERERIETLPALRAWLERTPTRRSSRREVPLPRTLRLSLPEAPGVYRLLGRQGNVLYVGKATSLKQRVNSYFRGNRRDEKTLELVTQVWSIEVTPTATALEAALLESDEIKRHDPPYNRQLRVEERRLLFTSADLQEVREAPDSAHPLGPFASAYTLSAFSGLMGVLSGKASAMVPLYGLDDPAVLQAGFAEFRRCHALDGAITVEALLALGAELWAAEMRQRAAEALDPEASTSEPGEDPLPDELGEAPGESWTPERVADALGYIVMYTAHQVRRAELLALLIDASLEWTPPGRSARRQLVFARGQVAGCRDVDGELVLERPAERPLLDRLADFDLATYDRLRVCLQELRRMARQTPDLLVRLADGRVLDPAALAELFTGI